jgi:phosphoenolpyruvate-protein kinase (PTS system EI component)
MEIGITLEVPAAALMAEQLAAHLDFFSLGTNDLTQYTMAAERGDARLASLLAPPQPAVLRLVKLSVDAAATAVGARGAGAAGGGCWVAGAAGGGCWVGVCGEMAGDPASALLLVGLGVTELSMSPGLIPGIKETLRSVTFEAAAQAAALAMHAPDAAAARAYALELL